MHLSHALLRVAVASLLLCAAGCIPVRHNVTPTIAGTAFRGDLPEAQAQFALSTASTSCAKPARRAITDASGRFVLAPVVAWTVLIMNGARRRQQWQLCALMPDSTWQAVYRYDGGALFDPVTCRVDLLVTEPRAICTNESGHP
jgi:hypothetical protein